jgi:hypothetical protein
MDVPEAYLSTLGLEYLTNRAKLSPPPDDAEFAPG